MATDIKQRLTLRSRASAAPAEPPTASPCSPEPTAIRQARHTVDRLYRIEQELARRIIEHHQVDRELRRLLAEMHICSSRVRAQIDECAAGCHRADMENCTTVICDRRTRR